MLDDGQSCLTVTCAELLATATRLESGVEAYTAADQFTPKPFELEPLAVAAPLAALGLRPVPPVDRFETNLVFAIYVQSADRTVQSISFHLEGELADLAPACHALARAVGATLRAGPRSVGGAGELRLGDLVLGYPAGWVVRHGEQPRIERLVELGDPPSSAYVLTTDDARYLNARQRVETWQRTPAVILGDETEWRCFEHFHQTAQAIVRHPERPGTFIDLRGTATRREDLPAACRLLEGVTLAPSPR